MRQAINVVTTVRVLERVPAGVRLVPVFSEHRYGCGVQVGWVREPIYIDAIKMTA
jgi:hypothetical protein